MVVRLSAGSFYGRAQAARKAPDITLLESVYSPEQSLPPHEHAAAFFDLIVDGTCSERIGGRLRERGCATLAFHPPGEVHSSCWHGPNPRCFHVEVGDTLMARARQYSPVLDHPRCLAGGTPVRLATRLCHEYRHIDELSVLSIEGLTLELLAETLRLASSIPERKPPPWLKKVREILHDDLAAPGSLDVIADSVGVHPAHLARVFRQFLGCTVGDYLRQLRAEFACRLLITSETPLVEIALAAGYADQSHFSRMIRRHTGVSPTEFRNSYSARKGRSKEGSSGTRS
jgi:AraC family transcriptional regulator